VPGGRAAHQHRTAQAAEPVRCTAGPIVKSLMFRGARSGRRLFVVARGTNRVDEARLGELAGKPIAKADAAFVRTHTGCAIGGVAPVGHPAPLETYIDADLLQYEMLWAAAGTPNAVFALTPADLQRIADRRVLSIAKIDRPEQRGSQVGMVVLQLRQRRRRLRTPELRFHGLGQLQVNAIQYA